VFVAMNYQKVRKEKFVVFEEGNIKERYKEDGQKHPEK
jgi:hypothetical protein